MAILLLRDRARARDHAVLLVRDGDRSIVLDNLRELAPIEEYGSYSPLLALTSEGSWRPKSQPPAAASLRASSGTSRW
jgi:hypothetical protein